ncbi:hypothetical protein [Nannocystis bainbridge]|uniref:Uncharacterized protein n=1 Tax=Nannocystis bainbridge TaxID=2995303 RepID=A0ABT5E619_9BACT|nr:hypothetical protein [Nannocystis bainbridge]MDC0720789.1 hypothetical protein [Nannocystis bainbridge]
MTRSSFTAILLGGALAGGCSKPNPLFLDTWDPVTDSSSQSMTSVGPSEPTTLDPPVTVTGDPPTTTSTTDDITSTVSSDPSTTTGPNPTTETTGEPFLCPGDQLDMEGCCFVDVPVAADTFFSDANDGVGTGCTLSDLPVEYSMLECKHVSFGRAPTVSLFKDNGNIGPAYTGTSVMALRFPLQDGRLVSKNGPIESEQIESIHLEMWAQYQKNVHSDLKFAVHVLDASLEWDEGDGDGATGCANGLASFHCFECGAQVGNGCAMDWGGDPQPVQAASQPLGIVDFVGDGNSGIEPIDLKPLGEPKDWVPQLAGGFVLVPHSSKYMGTSYDEWMPFPGVTVEAREGLGDDPKLRARVCMR